MKITEIVHQIDTRLNNQLFNLGNYPTLADIFLYNNISTLYYLTNWHVKTNNLEKWSKRLVEGSDFKPVEDKLRAFAGQVNQTNARLYYNPLSPPSRACHMVACHLNVPVEVKVSLISTSLSRIFVGSRSPKRRTQEARVSCDTTNWDCTMSRC